MKLLILVEQSVAFPTVWYGLLSSNRFLCVEFDNCRLVVSISTGVVSHPRKAKWNILYDKTSFTTFGFIIQLVSILEVLGSLSIDTSDVIIDEI